MTFGSKNREMEMLYSQEVFRKATTYVFNFNIGSYRCVNLGSIGAVREKMQKCVFEMQKYAFEMQKLAPRGAKSTTFPST